MPKFAVKVTAMEPEPYAFAPTIRVHLNVAESTGAQIHAMVLKTMVRIEPQKRRYSPEEEGHLAEVFGEPSRWGETLKPFLLAEIATVIPAFAGSCDIVIPLSFTYDLEVAAGKYFHGLSDGEIPLVLLFSGTVFSTIGPRLAVEPIPWSLEANYRLPVSVWQATMDHHFPASGWLRLPRHTIDDLGKFKSTQALATWEEAIGVLLKHAGEDDG
ncbi:MAG: DUF6084 family protein [Acidimicrobiales bacterium]